MGLVQLSIPPTAEVLAIAERAGGANRIRPDDGDGFALVAGRGNEAYGLPSRVDLHWIRFTHVRWGAWLRW